MAEFAFHLGIRLLILQFLSAFMASMQSRCTSQNGEYAVGVLGAKIAKDPNGKESRNNR